MSGDAKRRAKGLRASEVRTLKAIAEAVAPGHLGLLAAERDVPVVEPTVRFLQRQPPGNLLAIRIAIRLIEWLPFPWRFSRMSVAAREDYLDGMGRSRLATYRDLQLLAKTLGMLGWARDPEVNRQIGFSARCAVREGTPQPSAGSLGDLEPLGSGESCDVAIVGSGAGGAAAAATLAEAGLDVMVLEAGPHVSHTSYPRDPADALPMLYRASGLTMSFGRPSIPVPVGHAVGGTTVINSGTCFRAPDEVLAEWRDLAGVRWAMDLAADYEAAERIMSVTALDPERMGRNGRLCMQGAAAIGAGGGPISRNAGDCVQCSACPLGCSIDAKQAMHVSYLPRAVAAGARVRAGVRVERVLIEKGSAVGLECRAGLPVNAEQALVAQSSPDRPDPAASRPYTVRARTVISAGGAYGTPELLMRSGVTHRDLGRHLHIHPAGWIGALYDEPVRGWEGVMQSYYVDQWEKTHRVMLEATFTPFSFGAQWLPGVGLELAQRLRSYDRLGSIGVHLHDRSEGRIRFTRRGELRVSYRLRRDEARDLHFGIARAAEIHFAAGATEVYPNVGAWQVLKPDQLADFEAMNVRPNDLKLEGFHPMSTARMGADPKSAPLDVDGSVRGVKGLYATDASIFPTSVGVNPMMTIVATASHLARGIAGRVSGRSGVGETG